MHWCKKKVRVQELEKGLLELLQIWGVVTKPGSATYCLAVDT